TAYEHDQISQDELDAFSGRGWLKTLIRKFFRDDVQRVDISLVDDGVEYTVFDGTGAHRHRIKGLTEFSMKNMRNFVQFQSVHDAAGIGAASYTCSLEVRVGHAYQMFELQFDPNDGRGDITIVRAPAAPT